jgi:hypothetical protein
MTVSISTLIHFLLQFHNIPSISQSQKKSQTINTKLKQGEHLHYVEGQMSECAHHLVALCRWSTHIACVGLIPQHCF